MNDPYAREERIAIRIDSHMSERHATELTDAEQQSLPGLAARIAAMQQHQAMQPKQFKMHKRVDTAALAAGSEA